MTDHFAFQEVAFQEIDFAGASPEVAGAKKIIEAAAKTDGQKAISDGALLEAASGKRLGLGAYVTGQLRAVGVVGRGEIDLVVDPSTRSMGIGSATFAELLRRSTIHNPKVWVHGTQTGAEKILQQNGFKPVRTLLRMTCPPGRALAAKTQIPQGFTVTTYADLVTTVSTVNDAISQDSQSQHGTLTQIVDVNAAAFATHPEQGKLTITDFQQIMQEDWFAAEDLLLCWQEKPKKLAGFGWIKTTPSEQESNRLETELYVIGVHPDFAGKGLGSALLEAVFVRMATHDPTRITLYVEGDNEPALKVYFKAGFTVHTRSQQWQLV